ncbi:hypothetical protein OHA72_05990 [Dactylosporangium sp. NBC_01737]|uniref:hypothetical protein n=1 Tax=Dactylosporangium sp. NBC_01737 TaxID=2975959 RepID=UPI002E137B4A|nr:hypothetical protein OHA72_05990 [Dactylosporangium sp. NBC_01737]
MQEAFTRAFAQWSTVSTFDDPVGWVRRVAWNLAISRWRRAKRLLHLRRDLIADDVPGPDALSLDLVRALRQLTPPLRQAVVLHYLADLAGHAAVVAQQRATADTHAVAQFVAVVRGGRPSGRRPVVGDFLRSLVVAQRDMRHVRAGTAAAAGRPDRGATVDRQQRHDGAAAAQPLRGLPDRAPAVRPRRLRLGHPTRAVRRGVQRLVRPHPIPADHGVARTANCPQQQLLRRGRHHPRHRPSGGEDDPALGTGQRRSQQRRRDVPAEERAGLPEVRPPLRVQHD